MKKGMLALLLIFPFLIAFLAFTTSDYLIKGVEQDIDDIEIDYPSLAPFGLKQGKVKLQAESVYNEDYPLSEGNDLVFSVPEDQQVARIDVEEDGYYFVPLSEGQVEVTVSNRKGNVSRSFIALVYGEAGALVLNLDCPFSSAGMASYYWGTYDIVYDSLSSPYYKHTAKFTFSAEVVGNDAMDVYDFILSYSDNLSVDLSKSEVTVLGPGQSYISFTHPFSSSAPETRLEFVAVEAVNVYSYADLLKSTNLSENGEAVVLHLDLDGLDGDRGLLRAGEVDCAEDALGQGGDGSDAVRLLIEAGLDRVVEGALHGIKGVLLPVQAGIVLAPARAAKAEGGGAAVRGGDSEVVRRVRQSIGIQLLRKGLHAGPVEFRISEFGIFPEVQDSVPVFICCFFGLPCLKGLINQFTLDFQHLFRRNPELKTPPGGSAVHGAGAVPGKSAEAAPVYPFKIP